MKLAGLALACVLIPAVVHAQPEPPPPAPYAADPPPPPPAPEPYAPPPPPQPYSQPQPPPPGYGYTPGAAQDPFASASPTARRGVTFEIGLGVGFGKFSGEGDSDSFSTDPSVGFGIGLLGWLNPQLAIGARGQAVVLSNDDELAVPDDVEATFTNAWFGPVVQYWPSPNLFLSGGIGVSRFAASGDDAAEDNGIDGYGFDLRAGYSFPTSTNHSFNLSLEVTPCFYDDNNADGTITTFAFLASYQYL